MKAILTTNYLLAAALISGLCSSWSQVHASGGGHPVEPVPIVIENPYVGHYLDEVFEPEDDEFVPENFVADDTAYAILKRQYSSRKNTVPSYEDFQPLGAINEKECVEFYSTQPHLSEELSINVYSKLFAAIGDEIPERTIERVIAVKNATMGSTFDLVKNDVQGRSFVSTYDKDKDVYWSTYIRKRVLEDEDGNPVVDEDGNPEYKLYFSRTGKRQVIERGEVAFKKFRTYGFCFSHNL